MSIIRRRSGSSQKVGVKKMASVPNQQTPLNLNPGPKSTLVSGIVDQLIKSGYKGDLMSSAGMTYAQPDTPEAHLINDNPQEELHEDVIVDDIDFESQQKEKQNSLKEEEALTPSEKRKRDAAILEQKTRNSQQQIENVSKEARVLYGHIDSFISHLREAAANSRDNQRLGQKLENLRRICIGFVRNMEQQMPHYATSLFVNLEEENND